MGNKLFNIAYALLGESSAEADEASSAIGAAGEAALKVVKNVVQSLVPIIFGIVTAVGVIYGIFLGINYAKAEDTQKREEAKKKLINAIIGFGIAIIAAAVMWAVVSIPSLWDNFVS